MDFSHHFSSSKKYSVQEFKHELPEKKIAAPSWVIPGSLEENCFFLSGRVHEVGILFFETKSSTNYRPSDIPAHLADLSLSFHVHLPGDLTWNSPAEDASTCYQLLEKVSHLKESCTRNDMMAHCRAVLHPPQNRDESARALALFAESFTRLGGDISLIFLENIRENDLVSLEPVIEEYGYGVCTDFSHMLIYGQEKMLDRTALMENTRILHISAPGTGISGERVDKHCALTSLDSAEMDLLKRLFQHTPDDAVIMLEIFNWNDIEVSLPIIRSCLLPLV